MLVVQNKYCFIFSQESVFDDILDTNLKGTFLVNQAAAKSMLSSNLKEGSIINISSVSGITVLFIKNQNNRYN